MSTLSNFRNAYKSLDLKVNFLYVLLLKHTSREEYSVFTLKEHTA